MSDNVSLPAIGKTVATEDIGGDVHVQRVKVTWGPTDTATDADSSSGNGLPTSDNGASWATTWGVSAVPFTSADQHSAAASVTAAPTSGKKLVIDDILFSVDTAMSVTFKEETSGTVISGPYYLPANGSMQITPRGKLKLPVADRKLQVLTSVSGNIMVHVGYHSEA